MDLLFCKRMNQNPKKCKDGSGSYDTSKLISFNGQGEVLSALLTGNATLFEWTQLSDQVQPFFDVDYNAEGLEDYKDNLSMVLPECVENIQEMFPDLKKTDLRISSYNGLTNKGEYKVSYHILLHGYKISVADNKTVADKLNQSNPNIDKKVYRTAGLMRVGGHHKEPPQVGTRSPKLLYYCEETDQYKEVQSATKEPQGIPLDTFRLQHLIKYVHPDYTPLVDPTPDEMIFDAPAPQPAPALENASSEKRKRDQPEAPTVVNSVLLTQLSALPESSVDEMGQWWYLSTLLKAMNEKATWQAWSKLSTRYNAENNAKIWSKMAVQMTVAEAKKRLLKKLVTETDLIMRVHQACNDGSSEEMCELFVEQWGHLWKVVGYPKEIYMFDEADALWKKVPEQRLNTFLTEYFSPLRKEYVAQLNDNPAKFFGAEFMAEMTSKERTKLLTQAVKNANVGKMTSVKNLFRVEFFNRKELQDPLFRSKLNLNPDVVSTLDGLVCLKTGAFRKRRYDDYVSKCLAINYDPTQANPVFEQFMRDIFDHPALGTKDIVDWMQVNLGYNMTGHNSAHSCTVLHGSGGNGKSVLNDVLFKTLDCQYGQMINSWDSKFMDDNRKDNEATNSATPELAKLVDCNIGIINETKKSMVFGQEFKKWNDTCHKFSYRQLHCAPSTARLITSFIMSTNHFPQFPVEDAYIRRIKPVPMWVKFKDEPDPKVAWEKPKDEGLMAKMTGTEAKLQGILNWFIAGAIKWYANDQKLLTFPPCLEAQKQRYINQNDWTRLFDIGTTAGLKKTDEMFMEDVKHLIRINNMNGECALKQKEIVEKLTEKGATSSRVMNMKGTKEVRFRFLREKKSAKDDDDDSSGDDEDQMVI